MDNATYFSPAIKFKAVFCALIGISGPISKTIYQSPWWRPGFVTIQIKTRSLLLNIRRFVLGKGLFHFVGIATCLFAIIYGLKLDRDTILTTTATLVGLSSITIALIVVLTSFARGYADWLWLALNDSGIKVSLALNVGLMYFTAARGDFQSLAWSFPTWIQLLRSVFIAFQMFTPHYDMISRTRSYAEEHFRLNYPAYSRTLFALGNPYIRAIREFSLRLELSCADLMVGRTRAGAIQTVMTPSSDGTMLSVRLICEEIQDVLDRINGSLKERFVARNWKTSPASLMQRHARWFSENAANAAKEHRWAVFEEILAAYAMVAKQVCNTLGNLDEAVNTSGTTLTSVTYTWNAPTEAFEYSLAFAPRPQAQNTCSFLGGLMYSMSPSAQSVHDYVDLILLPAIRALLFKRDIADLPSIGKSLSHNIQQPMLSYLNDTSFIRSFFWRGEVIIQITESLRLLQTSFEGAELHARQAVGIAMISSIVQVGGFTNNGAVPEARDIIRREVNNLLQQEKWDQLIGHNSVVGIVLSPSTTSLLRKCFEQVHTWA
ncbi:MAG: hypothetical protein OWT27_10280 [Firmicutes bacterium]|nr:hypothetical protein [Bacillota bacterium]